MPSTLFGLSVFAPWGLWALLALAIPILIHLFNRSRGRLVRIGHIDLIRKARRLRVTEIKLAQWLLLLLRLGIFTLAALMLAGLASPGLDSSEASTAYVTPAWLRSVQQPLLDDLLTSDRHDRVFVLQPGFPPLKKSVADDIQAQSAGIHNAWPLLAERLSLEHHGGSVDVYAVDLLEQFGPSRPALPRPVTWNITRGKIMPAADKPSTSVVIAYDTGHRQDADIIKAALSSLRAHRMPGLTWETTDSRQITSQQLNPDWLIYLSDKDLTFDQLASINTPTNVLTDAVGDLVTGSLQYVTLPFYPYSTFKLDGLAEAPDKAQSIITLADGSPVLQEYHSGPTRVLRFNSRFNPQWSSITQQAEFPEFLLQLMLGTQQPFLSFNKARIAVTELQSENPASSAATPLPRRSLQSLLAILLVLLWVTERWLSERKPREVS